MNPDNIVTLVVIPLLAASLALVGQRLWGDVSAFKKQQQADEKRRQQQQRNLLKVLLADVERLEEIAAHNAERRGELLKLPADIWRSVFFRTDSILPANRALLEAVSTLVIQASEVDTRIRMFHQDRTVYQAYPDSVIKQCTKGGTPGPASPYNIPATLDLVRDRLKDLQKELTEPE